MSGDLSNLGRREEALTASEEAVAIRRTLAQDRPDAFLPDLALSVSVRGDQFRSLNRQNEAFSDYLEAVRLQAGQFLALPQAHADRMVTFLKDYIGLAQELSRDLDAGLLGPIFKKLEDIGAVSKRDASQTS